MKSAILILGLLAAGCHPRVDVRTAPPTQVDAFAINCAGNVYCSASVPARSFTTSAAPAGGIMVTRNGLVLYPGAPTLDYTSVADASGKVTVTFNRQPVTDADLILIRYVSGAPPPQPPSGNVQFIKTDTTTQGTWLGIYGADGYYLAGDASQAPAYGAVTFSGQQNIIWAFSTTDVRALQRPGSPAERIGAAWYSATSMNIDIALTDTAAHQLAIYAVDYDRSGRTQRIEVLDAAGAVADTRDQTPGDGQYLVWTVKGHVALRITSIGTGSALVAAVFLR